MIKNLIFDIKLILKQTNSNILFLVKNKVFICFISFFIFLSMTIPVIFIPITFSFASVIQLSTLIPIGICFAALSYNGRKSTLYKNMMIGKNNKYNQNISVLFTMYVLCIMLTLTVMFLIFIFSEFEILLTGGMTNKPTDSRSHSLFNLDNFPGGMLFYTQSVNVVWMFAYCFLFQRIMKTEKAFYTSILILTILLIILGGTFNDYFDNYERGLLENPDTYIPVGRTSIFPQSFFIVSLFIPFYATAQVIVGDINNFGTDDFTSWIGYTSDMSSSIIDSGYVNAGNSMSIGGSAGKGNILWFVPYIHITVFSITGIVFSKMKKMLIVNNIRIYCKKPLF